MRLAWKAGSWKRASDNLIGLVEDLQSSALLGVGKGDSLKTVAPGFLLMFLCAVTSCKKDFVQSTPSNQ